MGIQAARHRSGIGGAWRVWALGKALDQECSEGCNHEAGMCRRGTGMIRRDDLRAFALSLGVNVRTWERWLNQARANDLVTDIQKRDGHWWLILPSAGRAAVSMGCESVGTRKVTIQPAALIGQGWRARIFTAWESGKQISREQIQKAVNVPVRTQVYRAAQMGKGYKRTRNYAKSNLRAEALAGIREYTKHKAPYVMRDGFIAWRLPDTRETEHAQPAGKGRARKANRIIQIATRQKGLSQTRQALADDVKQSEYIRLFNLTESQRKASERRIAKSDKRINELYQRADEAKSGAVMWKHCPTGGQ